MALFATADPAVWAAILLMIVLGRRNQRPGEGGTHLILWRWR